MHQRGCNISPYLSPGHLHPPAKCEILTQVPVSARSLRCVCEKDVFAVLRKIVGPAEVLPSTVMVTLACTNHSESASFVFPLADDHVQRRAHTII